MLSPYLTYCHLNGLVKGLGVVLNENEKFEDASAEFSKCLSLRQAAVDSNSETSSSVGGIGAGWERLLASGYSSMANAALLCANDHCQEALDAYAVYTFP